MLKRILLALDSSDSGQVAISFTIALAGSDTEVRVLHINELLLAGRAMTVETPTEARFLLDDAVLQLRCCGVTATGVVATGVVATATCFAVAECIITEADRWSADAIVLGSARRRGLRRIVSHGVRERVIRSSCLPVLTAPAPLKVAHTDLAPAPPAVPGHRGTISRLHH
jgi:nucleotide-binding universal stress UspA family protein